MENNNKSNESAKPIENKSTGKVTGEIDFSKEIKINRIFADVNLIAQHKDRLRKGIKNITEQMLDLEVVQMVIKDNLFSAVMETLVSYFEFTIDITYRDFLKANIKNSLLQATGGKEPDDRVLSEIAEKMIKKEIVMGYLASLWKMEVSDQEVKDMLDVYYQRTNDSIREVLDDKDKFEGIRRAILDEKLLIRIIASFPMRFDLRPPAAQQGPINFDDPAPAPKKN